MQSLKIEDLIVPIAEYATVSQDATLYDAIQALTKAQAEFDQSKYMHRAILVLDEKGEVVGKLSKIDVIRGLEPNYKNIGQFPDLKHWGLSKETASNILKELQLWQKPLKDICKKANSIHVRDIMSTPEDGEYVSREATLDEAIHQLVIGQHQSLLVVDDQKVTGILRLSDIFSAIAQLINQCEV